MKKNILILLVTLPLLLLIFTRCTKHPHSDDVIHFNIPSTQGLFDLKNEAGKVVFIYFGFTRCPHICPTTLTQLTGFFKTLNSTDQNKVKFLFVSIDPENDNLSVLKNHLKLFNSQFVGATNKDEELQKIIDIFGASYSRKGAINHTSSIFIVNQKGLLIDILPYNANIEDLKNIFYSAENKPSLKKTIDQLKALELIADNRTCDLSEATCYAETNKEKIFKVSFASRPLLIQNKNTLNIEALSEWIPVEVHIQGVELNMGLLLEAIVPVKGESHFASFINLPTCELQKMTWEFRITVKNKRTGIKKSVLFVAKTFKV
jgi:protein SCO1